jgi:hypothetical protein
VAVAALLVVAGLVAWIGLRSAAGLEPSPAMDPGVVAGVGTSGPTSVPASGAGVPTPSVPAPSPSPTPSPTPASPAAEPSVAPSATPAATPRPERRPVDVRIEGRPGVVFTTEFRDTWCAAAAVQIALNVNGPRRRVDTSRARQAEIRDLQVALTTRRDSRNGGAGPLGMIGSLEALGSVDYELRRYATRDDAMRGAARAISETGHAAILLAWRGAHAWVMTGYRATADPSVFRNARVTGAYILDPWYPRVSSIWGASDRPGVFQDRAEMRRNFLPWRRPEGRYPNRDGRFLVIIPVS